MGLMKKELKECSVCGQVRLIHYRTETLCGPCNKNRLIERHRANALNRPARSVNRKKKPIRRMTTKRSAIERDILKAKAAYKADHEGRGCESCGTRSDHLGVSHIISVNDCINDNRFPVSLASDPTNLVWECHTGKNCHAVTESKHRDSYKAKFGQWTFRKKMDIYKQHAPWIYDDIREWMDEHGVELIH